MNEYNVGNIILNAGLVGIIVFFGKKWINNVESTAEINRKEISDLVHENRVEYQKGSKDIIASIKELSDHVATANGRTSKNEARISVIEAICKERHNENITS
jgi:hypothetical protein